VPSPAERARQSLAESRAQGEGFRQAWRQAQRSALINVDRHQRGDWQVALRWSKRYFAAAYYGDPSDLLGRTLDEQTPTGQPSRAM